MKLSEFYINEKFKNLVEFEYEDITYTVSIFYICVHL